MRPHTRYVRCRHVLLAHEITTPKYDNLYKDQDYTRRQDLIADNYFNIISKKGSGNSKQSRKRNGNYETNLANSSSLSHL